MGSLADSEESVVAVQSQLEGQQIGRYLIRQRLGGGGVASVYQAYDQVSGQSVALKVLPPNPDAATLNRFRREALMAGALRHPNIVRILHVGTVGDGPSAYIAMDLVEGESLAALLARFGQLPPEESCRLLEPIARALAFAHRQGVVHRDVKPSNILLRPVSLRSSNSDVAKAELPHSVNLELLEHDVVPLLSDFGIARFLDAPELTNAGRTVGTPAFMAPEQCMGSREVDGRADIYSLGTVLYRCVVGRLPFNGSTTQILHAHVFEPVVIEEDMARLLPPKVVEILRRTLAKAPEDRYQDADSLADELTAVGAVVASVAAPESGDEAHTVTMTMAQIAAVAPHEPTAVQVLVPGTTSVENAVANVKAKEVVSRKRGPSLERMLWAALYVVILVGGGYYGVRSWFAPQSNRGNEPLSLPPVALATYTPTPSRTESLTAQLPISATVTSSESAVVIAATPLPTATPFAIATATATQVPTVVPTMAPTAIPETVVEAPSPTPLPIATETIPPGEEIAGACSTVVDEFFLPMVAALTGTLAADFTCPSAPAHIAVGDWLPFDNGVMVAIEGRPLVYVYYANGSWEQVARGEGDLPLNAPANGTEIAPLPPPFRGILGAEGRHLLLGEPKLVEPLRGETLVQPFNGGVLLGNRGSGQVLLLARSTLRF